LKNNARYGRSREPSRDQPRIASETEPCTSKTPAGLVAESIASPWRIRSGSPPILSSGGGLLATGEPMIQADLHGKISGDGRGPDDRMEDVQPSSHASRYSAPRR